MVSKVKSVSDQNRTATAMKEAALKLFIYFLFFIEFTWPSCKGTD